MSRELPSQTCLMLAVLFPACAHTEPNPSSATVSVTPSVPPSASAPSVPQAVVPTEPPPSVVGVLLLDQPGHGAYEATEYSFFPGGQLGAWRLRGGQEVGAVSHDGVTCTFGDRWAARDGGAVAIDGDCSDGQDREILLSFGDTSASGSGEISVISVAGQPGWTHEGWPWRALRCGDAPGLRCSEQVEQGITVSLDPAVAPDLPALTAACTREDAGTLQMECAMLGMALRQNDRRTLESLLQGELPNHGAPLPEAAVALLAEVDARGGPSAWAGGVTPKISHDCLSCARGMLSVSVQAADGATRVMNVEGGHAPTIQQALAANP